MSAGTNIQTVNFSNIPSKMQTNFRAQSSPVKNYPPDTVEINGKIKTGMSTGAKVGIGFGILGSAAVVALAIKKNRYSEVKKLAENINFEKAKTIEDAIKWGKENLGIRHYGGFESQDIEAINWINEGLTNTSNKMKGKLRVPKSIWYTDKVLGENTLAGVCKDATGEYAKYNGQFYVNKNIFRNLDAEIDSYLKKLQPTIDVKGNKFDYDGSFAEKDMQRLACDIMNYKNGKLAGFDEKLNLYESLDNLARTIYSINEAPFYKIKQILAHKKCVDILQKLGFETNLEKIKNMSLDQQSDLFADMLEPLKDIIEFSFKPGNRFRTLYHEMGHLQDTIPRILAKGKYKKGEAYSQELKEWLDNSEYMQTAARVSEYATTGPGEFIAETFADMVIGKKLPKEVIDLYKKLNGPMI